MSFISSAPERLSYFELQLGHPDWHGRQVLDFGGNRGTLLSTGRIDQRNYWCIDISRDAIETGRHEYPQAHWIFYDRYNFAFNPTGIPGLPVPLTGERFDYILAYSVFTHTSKEEMLELVDVLRNFLTDDGALAFTFRDPHYRLPMTHSQLLQRHRQPTNLALRLEKVRQETPAFPVESMLREAARAEWCTLAGDDLYIEHENIQHRSGAEGTQYETFYTARFMQRIFPLARILPSPRNYNPGAAEMQHCCVLRKR